MEKMTPGQKFLKKHTEYIAKGDIDGLLRDHYHDNAEMVTYEFTLKGKKAIKKYLAVDGPAKSGKILGFTMNHFVESKDVISFTATIKSEKLGVFIARDTFFLRDGKVYRHIALTVPPDKDLALYKTLEKKPRAVGSVKYPIVHRFMGKFMELPRDHVNAYIVELENSAIVVDTTLALSSAQELRAEAESFGKPVKAVLMTHGHPDHYTGLVAFSDVPRIGSQGCVDFAKREDVIKSPTATSYLGDDYPKSRIFPNKIVKSGDSFVFDGIKFVFYDLGPGESDSDGMWIFRQDGISHVFIGDTIALNCHCFFRDGHILEWQKILERLKSEFDERTTRFYIGHGESPCGMEAVDWQMGYNKAFINAIAQLPKTVPVIRETQEKVLAAMKTYLPGDATLFLLDYEMGETIAGQFKVQERFIPGRGKDFYKEQLGLMASGKIDELVESHYHPEAVMVTFDGMRRGHQELKKYYVDTLKIMGKITFMATEYFAEIEDVIIFRATITSDGRGTVQALNGLYMKDGKILRHIALTLLPDVDYDKLGTKWSD